jgi:gas vesicle protein GvpK
VTVNTRDKLLVEWEDLPQPSIGLDELSPLPRRIDADPERVERGLAHLVLTLVELLRQLMERQALRRVDHGNLTEDEVERLGLTFMRLEERMEELKREFGLEDADLNIDLGPLGRLVD